MKNFCIPREYYEKLKEGIDAGVFDNYETLRNIRDTKKRREIFEKFLPKDLAKKANIGFERAMYKDQKSAYESWAKNIKGLGVENKNDITSKIDRYFKEVDDIAKANLAGERTTEYPKLELEDLASAELGINITTEEMKEIKKMSDEIKVLEQTVLKNFKANDINSIESEFFSLNEKSDEYKKAEKELFAYYKQKKEILDYIKATNPTTNSKAFSSLGFKLNLLAGIKSSIVNEVSSVFEFLSEKTVRRLSPRVERVKNKKGKTVFKVIFKNSAFSKNGDLTTKFRKFNRKLYSKTGYELARMENINEDQRILGEKVVSLAGKGKEPDSKLGKYLYKFGESKLGFLEDGWARTGMRYMEDTVFRKGFHIRTKEGAKNFDDLFNFSLGSRDANYAAVNFGDSADINSQTIARKKNPQASEKEIKRISREIMLDSMNIIPLTKEGSFVREVGRMAAFRGTFTHETGASKFALDTRNALNNLSLAGIEAGDVVIPFAKTPANVVSVMLDYSGTWVVPDIIKMKEAWSKGDIKEVNNRLTNLTRAGVGIVGVISLMAILDDMVDLEDYVSEYADFLPKERQLIKAKGATYNSILMNVPGVGKTWVSLDYFGPIGASMVGYMNQKKYGDTLGERALKFYQKSLIAVAKIPGYGEMGEVLSSAKRISNNVNEGNFEELSSDLAFGFSEMLAPRVIPALLSDLAMTFDKYERKKETSLSHFQSRIPGLRKGLPTRIGLFGEENETQPGATQLLFGSRLKKSKDGPVIDEINALSQNGQTPAISSIEYSSSRMKELKKIIGTKKFNELMKMYGTKLNTTWNKIINKKAYQKLTDDKKKEILNKAKNRIVDVTYYNFAKDYINEIKEARKKEEK